MAHTMKRVLCKMLSGMLEEHWGFAWFGSTPASEHDDLLKAVFSWSHV